MCLCRRKRVHCDEDGGGDKDRDGEERRGETKREGEALMN